MRYLLIILLILSSCKSFQRKKQTDISIQESTEVSQRTQNGLSWSGSEMLLKSDKLELQTLKPTIITINGRDSVVYKTTILRQIVEHVNKYVDTFIDTTKQENQTKQVLEVTDNSSTETTRRRLGFSIITTIVLLIIIFLAFLAYKFSNYKLYR